MAPLQQPSMTYSPFPQVPLRGRVLIVEDASVYREMQSLLLRQASYDVVNCEDPIKALMTLSERICDAVVLNSDRPGVSAAEFITALRKERPSVAIIWITASLDADLARDMTRSGVSATLQRPVGPEQLIRKLDEVLGRSLSPHSGNCFAEPSMRNPGGRLECTWEFRHAGTADPSNFGLRWACSL